MAANDPDLSAFASDIQNLASQGGFDPFAMLGGSWSFHSVFLAPFTPSLTNSVAQFLQSGQGPLAGSVEVLRQQGNLTLEAAQARAREMFSAAQGMLVVVLSGEQGLSTIPQLCFGHLSPEYQRHVVQACANEVSESAALGKALSELAQLATTGAAFPALLSGPHVDRRELLTYWLELASGVVSSQEQLLPRQGERLADLGHWIAHAVAALGATAELDGDDLMALSACHLVAGEWQPAMTMIERAAAAGVDAEEVLERLTRWADTAAALGVGRDAAQYLATATPRFEALLGKNYDLVRAIFCLYASAQADAETLIATAEMMMSRDRKSCRHDLTREPVWAVRLRDPGELLETAQAATVVGRSHTYIAKRLEQGTIPSHRQGDQVRLPKAALLAWKALMERFNLWEG